MPGIIEGAKDGKGRGKQVIAGMLLLTVVFTHTKDTGSDVVVKDRIEVSLVFLTRLHLVVYVYDQAECSIELNSFQDACIIFSLALCLSDCFHQFIIFTSRHDFVACRLDLDLIVSALAGLCWRAQHPLGTARLCLMPRPAVRVDAVPILKI